MPVKPVPDGYHSVTPYLVCHDAAGAIDFYKAARANDLSPIVGVEAYLAPDGIAARNRRNFHLLLLAENERGYRNLLKLSSRASIEGYYYRPRVDLEMLNELSDGVICTRRVSLWR